jgi:hypothetical protein
MAATNVAGEKIVVFQHLACQLKVIDERAYSWVTPENLVVPWAHPYMLAPGESVVLRRFALRDGQTGMNQTGLIWFFTRPGKYKVYVDYVVHREWEFDRYPKARMPAGRIWIGTAKCGPIVIPVEQGRPAPRDAVRSQSDD